MKMRLGEQSRWLPGESSPRSGHKDEVLGMEYVTCLVNYTNKLIYKKQPSDKLFGIVNATEKGEILKFNLLR